jgi:hypothetical protein
MTLVDILREHWSGYARANGARLSSAHYRAVRRALACRTAELGGMLYRCDGCSKFHYAYHSCNHRNCPQCGSLDQQIWSAKQEARLLPVPYFMVTFTFPAQLRYLCLAYPKEIYNLILRESAGALSDVCATKTKGGRIGLTNILHTWGRQMQHHPHTHCIVPALAFHQQTAEISRPGKEDFLIHYRPLAERFRSRIHSALKNEHPDIYKNLSPEARHALSPKTRWNVNLQHVGRGKTALRYLSRYVQRSAFSPKRLLGYDRKGNIRLRWTCSSTGKSSVMTLSPHEFIRRWLLHVLPKGFTRVRHYGFLSSAAKKTRLKIRLLLGAGCEPKVDLPDRDPFLCEHCGNALQMVGSFPRVARLHFNKGPPKVVP